MRSKFFIGAMATLLLGACSQDEVMSVRQDGINYSVTTPNLTRAADSYCNAILPNTFKVWAETSDGELYINGDVIAKSGNNWVDQSGTRYWPSEGTLDFYAQVNGDDVFAFNSGAPTFNNFTVNNDVEKQIDLMYAVSKDLDKEDITVPLNFRHALSQVCFRAKNNTTNLVVQIKGVSVGHLTNGGTFTFPTVVNLTCPGDDHINDFAKVLTLMPQEVNAWDPTKTGTTYNGAYFLVDLVISNLSGTGGTTSEVYEGKAAVPVDIDWQQGYRYIYTFVFDEGGDGGWTPDPENPEPILTSMKWDVDVDDFIPTYPDGGNEGDGTHMDTDTEGKEDDDDEPVATYTLTFNGNKPADALETSVSNLPDALTGSVNYTIPSKTPSCGANYQFLGWSSNPNANEADYTDGESITLTDNLILYAVWKKLTHIGGGAGSDEGLDG